MNEYDFSAKLRRSLPGISMRIENAISSGLPDIALFYQGRTYWIETKMGRSVRLRPYQLATIRRMWHLGKTIVIVASLTDSEVHIYLSHEYETEFKSTHHLITSKPRFVIPLHALGDEICSVLKFVDDVS